MSMVMDRPAKDIRTVSESGTRGGFTAEQGLDRLCVADADENLAQPVILKSRQEPLFCYPIRKIKKPSSRANKIISE
jgi:hypothetical protein